MKITETEKQYLQVLKRLGIALEHLELTIKRVKATTQNKTDEVSLRVKSRIPSYDQILKKQRQLAVKICDNFESKNWEELSQNLKVVAGLSSLISNDAKEVVFGEKEEIKSAMHFC